MVVRTVGRARFRIGREVGMTDLRATLAHRDCDAFAGVVVPDVVDVECIEAPLVLEQWIGGQRMRHIQGRGRPGGPAMAIIDLVAEAAFSRGGWVKHDRPIRRDRHVATLGA